MERRPFLLGLAIAYCSLVMLQAQQQDQPLLDSRIRVLHAEALEYPRLARVLGAQGIVVVSSKLDSEGRVVSSSAISGNELLIKECLPNSLKWQFQPITAEVIILYDFGFNDDVCDWSSSPCLSQFTFREPNIATIRGARQLITHGRTEGN
jgi:hypothetical protein